MNIFSIIITIYPINFYKVQTNKQKEIVLFAHIHMFQLKFKNKMNFFDFNEIAIVNLFIQLNYT